MDEVCPGPGTEAGKILITHPKTNTVTKKVRLEPVDGKLMDDAVDVGKSTGSPIGRSVSVHGLG